MIMHFVCLYFLPEAYTEKHSPKTAQNLLLEDVARAEEESEVIQSPCCCCLCCDVSALATSHG